jgi:hypothetical protein
MTKENSNTQNENTNDTEASSAVGALVRCTKKDEIRQGLMANLMKLGIERNSADELANHYWKITERYGEEQRQNVLPDNLDEVLMKAFSAGWVFLENEGQWYKDGWRDRSTKEIYEEYT